jgi:uncharacterized protein (TIGR02646 family)
VRRVRNPGIPDHLLTDPGPRTPEADLSPGARERRKAIEHVEKWLRAGSPAGGPETFSYAVYSTKPVKAALRAAFGAVCVYCETPYEAGQPMAVEHFRPKSGWQDDFKGKPAKPGYYWLASTWENLLPACTRCNTGEWYVHRDGVRRKSGKGNVFPLAPGTRRAAAPGEERDETALLLHPYEDEPGEHLAFRADGSVQPADTPAERKLPRGRSTIDVVGLNRPGLIDARTRVFIQVELFLRNAADFLEAERCVPAHLKPRMRSAYERNCEALRDLARDGNPYCTMVRQLVPDEILK